MAGFVRFIVRDASIVATSLVLFWLDASARGHPGPWVTVLGVATGLSAIVCGFLFHEWGHLCGALWAHSVVAAPRRLTSPFLFYFDVAQNKRREFLAMSYGGYIASVLSVLGFACCLPRDTLSGRVALIGAALGVVATFVAELPTTLRVYRGAPLPQTGPAYVGKNEPSG